MSQTFLKAIALVFIGLSTTAICHAQIIPGIPAGPPPLTPLPTPILHFTINQGMPNSAGPGDYTLGSPTAPLPVSYSPTAGPFEKWLAPRPDQDSDGDVDLSDFSTFITTPILNLNEYLVVGQGPAWTDWHEQILTPDWAWGNVQIATPGTPPGPTNLVIQNSGTTVDFFFDPIVPGTPVDIRKQIFFTGVPTQQMINDFLQGTLMIRVAEYPTSVPEPASCVLVLMGLLAAKRLRRRAN